MCNIHGELQRMLQRLTAQARAHTAHTSQTAFKLTGTLLSSQPRQQACKVLH